MNKGNNLKIFFIFSSELLCGIPNTLHLKLSKQQTLQVVPGALQKLEMVNNNCVDHIIHVTTLKCQKYLISYKCVQILRIIFLSSDQFESK